MIVLPKIITPLENKSVTEGSECTFSVKVDAIPNAVIEWSNILIIITINNKLYWLKNIIRLKNDIKLKPDKRISTRTDENSFFLTISNVKLDDKGMFKAILKNKVGQTESQGILNVTGKTYFYFNLF